MDFEHVTHLNAIRKACKSKPIELETHPLYLIGKRALWRITSISKVSTPFGPPQYEVTCRSYNEYTTSIQKEEALLSKLVLAYEIPAKYPELLI